MADEVDGRLAVRRLLWIIGNKWVPVVLYELSPEGKRFGELHRSIGDISKKMLVQTLRRLEAKGLIHREVVEALPPQTRYRLTASGHRLREPVDLLCEWAKAHGDLLSDLPDR